MDFEQQYRELFGFPRKRNGDDLYFDCPECKHKSLSCSLTLGCYHCFHCHFKGRVHGSTPSEVYDDPVDLGLQKTLVRELLTSFSLSDYDRKELWGRGIHHPEKYGLKSTDLRPQRFLLNYSNQQLIDSGLFVEYERGVDVGGALSYGQIAIPYWSGNQIEGMKCRVSSLYDVGEGRRFSAPRGSPFGKLLWHYGTPRPGQDLIVTEGELKAIVCLEHGFWACSIPGINYYEQLAPQVSGLAQHAGRVFIILDSDAQYKTDNALQFSARYLARACGVRRAVAMFLPQNKEGEKMAVDDFLQQYGAEELEWWMEWAWSKKRLDGRPVFCS